MALLVNSDFRVFFSIVTFKENTNMLDLIEMALVGMSTQKSL